jgi:hypothetical protein
MVLKCCETFSFYFARISTRKTKGWSLRNGRRDRLGAWGQRECMGEVLVELRERWPRKSGYVAEG